MTKLLDRFRALPRSGKWLTMFVVFLVAFFGVVDPLLALNNKWAVKADQIQASLHERAGMLEKMENSRAAFESSVIGYGRPDLPTKSGDRLAALTRRVAQVLSAHEITEKRRNEKPATALAAGARTGAGAIDPRIERVGFEVQFECDTATLLAVLKDLESAPEVSSIARLDIRKIADSGRTINEAGLLLVSLTPETWAINASKSAGATPRPAADPAAGGAP